MKTYFPLLFICTLFLFNSCKPLEKVDLTTSNYVYEGELYRMYLNTEIMKVEESIDELQSIINNNQGNEQTENDLATNIEKKSSLNAELAGIPGLVNFSIIPPKPPCPIEDRTCFPIDFKHFLLSASTNISKLQISAEDGQEILMISAINAKKLAGTQGQFKSQLIGKQLAPGDIRVKVTRTDTQNNEIEYEVNATIIN